MNVYRVLHAIVLSNTRLTKRYRVPLTFSTRYCSVGADAEYTVLQDTDDLGIHLALGKRAYFNVIAGAEILVQRRGVHFL